MHHRSCLSISISHARPLPPFLSSFSSNSHQAMGGGSVGILQAGTTEEKGSNARLVRVFF